MGLKDSSDQPEKPRSNIDQPGSSSELPPDITDNPETDRVTYEISNREADSILQAEDLEQIKDNSQPGGSKNKLAAFFNAWLGNKRGRHWTYVALFIVAIALSTAPATRYWMLNEAGVRSSSTLTVMDGDTQLPLQNVDVKIGMVTATTNREGIAVLNNLKLGTQVFSMSRPGFAKSSQNLIIGWGGNPLGSYDLKDIGQQYTILVYDYLSGDPIGGAQAVSNGLDALSDKNGKITLTVDNPNDQQVQATITAGGYRTQNIILNGNGVTVLQLVPAQKVAFISLINGKYNLYKSDVDGQNQQLLLTGTATETSNSSLAVSPDNTQAVLVSTRDARYDSSGQLQTAITLVNMSSGSSLTVDHAEQIQLIGWIGTTVIYEEETSLTPTPSYSIIAYNYASNSRNQLAVSSQFNGVILAQGSIYYAIPASASGSTAGFFRVQADGSGKQTIINQDVWSFLRPTYSTLDIQTAGGWYSYQIGDTAADQLASAPSNLINRDYLDSADGKHSAWVNTTDSNNELLSYDISSNKNKVLATASGLSYPLSWLNNDDLIYQIITSDGNTEYVVNVNGQVVKRITDVASTKDTSLSP